MEIGWRRKTEPILFNLYGEQSTKEPIEGIGNIKIRSRHVETIKYADYLLLLAREKFRVVDWLDWLVEAGIHYGMQISLDKPKIMII